MAPTTQQSGWRLAERQHGVVARRQLLELGMGAEAIKHRVRSGRLHPKARGVYAVGRPEITRHGELMVAVLAAGPGVVVSHLTAAELYGLLRRLPPPVDLTLLGAGARRQRRGIRLHRRTTLGIADVTLHHDIPVTTPGRTIVDLAKDVPQQVREAVIDEADARDLIHPRELATQLDGFAGQEGVARLRRTLERLAFSTTRSHLERAFRTLLRGTPLPPPLTQQEVNGFRVDFFWPALGLVVETDGGRYHRTPAEQRRDRIRDQAHVAAGLAQLRFTHAQVAFEPEYVAATLIDAAARLRRGAQE